MIVKRLLDGYNCETDTRHSLDRLHGQKKKKKEEEEEEEEEYNVDKCALAKIMHIL
jgi:hypothetical protein